MKNTTLILLLSFLFPLGVLAQETILPITKVAKPNDFYKEQRRLWQKETDKSPQNAEAWYNYYYASRYYNFPAVFKDKAYKAELSQLIADMGKNVPDSYEYHYLYATHHAFEDDVFSHVLRAYELDPSRPQILEKLFTHHYQRGEWAKADEFIKRWYASKDMPPQLLHFGYNFLACTEKDAILITSGDNDSFPIWMLQSVMGIRTDVAALNAWLMSDQEFAQKALDKYGIKYTNGALAKLEPNNEKTWESIAQFIRHLAEQNPDRKIYLPVTTQKELHEGLKDDLYIVGTVFEYCSRHFDNIAVLKRNWSEKMKFDYLDFQVYTDDYVYDPKTLPYTVIHYLYPAITLYWHYETAGESQAASDALDFAKKVSRLIGKPDRYLEFKEAMKP